MDNHPITTGMHQWFRSTLLRALYRWISKCLSTPAQLPDLIARASYIDPVVSGHVQCGRISFHKMLPSHPKPKTSEGSGDKFTPEWSKKTSLMLGDTRYTTQDTHIDFFPGLPTVCPRARNSQHGDMCIYVFLSLIMYLENSLSSFVSIARAYDGPQPLPRRKSLLDSGSSLTCQASGGSWRMETIQVQRESRQTVETERMRLEQIIDYSRWTARWIDRQTDRLTDRQTERETERQRQSRQRQTDRQTNRQTDKQTDRYR